MVRTNDVRINESRAVKHLMDCLSIEGISRTEGRIADAVARKLKAAGCKPSWILRDQVHRRAPGGFECGNVIVRLPGTIAGARLAKLTDLGRPKMGFNIDSGAPAEFVTGALGAEGWEAHVHGRSSHAGVHPEHGISAALIAGRAIEDVAARGYFGKIVQGRRRGTSNVGRIVGGEATNQVTDHVHVTGESRSHDPKFVRRITEEYRRAFNRAAKSVKNHRRQCGAVRFEFSKTYDSFQLDPASEVVRHARAAARSIGMRPSVFSADGGLDANWLTARGVPTITFGAGQHGAHTIDEYINIPEYIGGCRLAVALATH